MKEKMLLKNLLQKELVAISDGLEEIGASYASVSRTS